MFLCTLGCHQETLTYAHSGLLWQPFFLYRCGFVSLYSWLSSRDFNVCPFWSHMLIFFICVWLYFFVLLVVIKRLKRMHILFSYGNLYLIRVWLLRHKASQDGRGEILLENSFRRWRCYQGKIMHTTSNNFSVLYVLKKHRQHINNTMTPPTLLFLPSWPSYTRASCHSKIVSIRINLRVSCSRCTSTSQK